MKITAEIIIGILATFGVIVVSAAWIQTTIDEIRAHNRPRNRRRTPANKTARLVQAARLSGGMLEKR